MATATDPPAPPIDDEPAPEGDILFEVIDGEVVECEPMGAYEAVLASSLLQVMGPYARSRGLGRVVIELLFRIDGDRKLSRRPDVAFVSAEHRPLNRRVPGGNAWAVAPDLAVEILGETTSAEEIARKIDDYFRSGVRRVWVVYSGSETVYVYSSPKTIRVLDRDDALEGEDLIPGFRLPLAELFGEAEAE